MAPTPKDREEASRYWATAIAGQGAEALGEEFEQLKKQIIQQYGEQNLRKSWLEVTSALAKEAETIVSQGSSIIPIVDASELNQLPTAIIDEIKQRGTVVIRNVLSSEYAQELQRQLDEYLRVNKEDIGSRPAENPWLFDTFFNPIQHKVRTNPRNLQAQLFLNSLWTGYTPDEAQPDPLIYVDALRHRRPGGHSSTVQPHIDAGSLDRWADDNYRHFYEPVFQGEPLAYDPFDIHKRNRANQAKFPGRSQCSAFRTFQGWTALSSSGEEFGRSSLAVYPNLKLAQAYVLLRPFFKPPPDNEASLDPTSWVLDESDSFPGSVKGLSQRVLTGTHPHLRLEETLTLTPRINPGDAVFWHSDVIHAVDPANNTDETATVLYIPAVPLTHNNVAYLKKQRDSLLANAQTPPDFLIRVGDLQEGRLKGWKDHSIAIGDNLEGRRAYGLEKLQGSAVIVKWANEVLGFS
ncbi:uncharacterized protein BDV17DRAFT_294641 [Aspergillus undulatus]|uniref:uncharacterized protein n=1 Tax=Aspergillus undulatus TaxID=1810928 RepID=UPI003CCDC783